MMAKMTDNFDKENVGLDYDVRTSQGLQDNTIQRILSDGPRAKEYIPECI